MGEKKHGVQNQPTFDLDKITQLVIENVSGQGVGVATSPIPDNPVPAPAGEVSEAENQANPDAINTLMKTGENYPFSDSLSPNQLANISSVNDPVLDSLLSSTDASGFTGMIPLENIPELIQENLESEIEHRLATCFKNLENFPFSEQISPEQVGQINNQSPVESEDVSVPAIKENSPNEIPDFQQAADPVSLSEMDEAETKAFFSKLSGGFNFSVPVQHGPSESGSGDAPTSPLGYDVHRYRKDFPILHRKVNGKPLVWLDNGATTQKPQVVIDAIAEYYEKYNSNIHRGAHELAREATDAFEEARQKVADFIGAKKKDEIVFVRGTTEGINLIANSFSERFIKEGDEIIISELEHHANIVPWQFAARKHKAKIVVARTDPYGDIKLDEYRQLFNHKTRIVAVSQVSNAVGTVSPIKEMIQIAHQENVPVLVDGAQSVQHMPVDVQDLDADFFVMSGHKIFAPMGIGAVYGKEEWLNKLPPWQGGGAMIADVTFENTEFNPPPTLFEAGTPNVEGPIGLKKALDYLDEIGMTNIEAYEHKITDYALEKLRQVPNLHLIGNPKVRMSVLSFVLKDIPNEVVGKELNKEGIAVRVGHHCAQPILRRLGHETAVRPSLAFYNTHEEIDFLVDVICRIEKSYRKN